jgi:hypothetical protein
MSDYEADHLHTVDDETVIKPVSKFNRHIVLLIINGLITKV